ncbi:hypothetical protein, partial [Nocardioides pocheonensis]|uniref:hypothetical protein n=1 Tax=Nocardioides pocheonensis TaxID=661485 RepID=UPI00161A63CD
SPDPVVSAGSTTQAPGSTNRRGGSTTQSSREVVLYVHLSDAALTSGDRLAPAWVENADGHLVTA